MIKLNYPNFWQTRSLASYLLLPLSWLYWMAGKIRTLFATQHQFPAPVICVGNITVGGTGKTQIIKSLAKHFTNQGKNYVIIVRSYRAKLEESCIVTPDMSSEMVGDEALELCKHGQVIATRHFTDGMELVKQLAPDVILVDDGMQNPYFAKDIQIVAIDGMRLFGNQLLLPAGPMRQSSSSAQADFAFIIDNNQAHINLPNVGSIVHISSSTSKDGDNTKQYIAFSGIGNPQKFFNSLKWNKYSVMQTIPFPDHHQYSDQDIASLLQLAEENNAALITTEKDIVKLRKYQQQISVLKVELVAPTSTLNELDKKLGQLP